MRRELLNGELFHSVLEAKVVINEWLKLYDTRRPIGGSAARPRPPTARCAGVMPTMTPVVVPSESPYRD
jgi:hypothetical protein